MQLSKYRRMTKGFSEINPSFWVIVSRHMIAKVIVYPKYYKRYSYNLAYTINCVFISAKLQKFSVLISLICLKTKKYEIPLSFYSTWDM